MLTHKIITCVGDEKIQRATKQASDEAAQRYVQKVIMLWHNMRTFLPESKLIVLCAPSFLGDLSTGIDRFIQKQAIQTAQGTYSSEAYMKLAQKHKINTTLELIMLRNQSLGGNTDALEAFHPKLSGKWREYERAMFVPLCTVFINNPEGAFEFAESSVLTSKQLGSVITFTKQGAHKLWSAHLAAYGAPRYPYEVNGEPSLHPLVCEVAAQEKEGLKKQEHMLFYESDQVANMEEKPEQATIVCFEKPTNLNKLPKKGIVGRALNQSSPTRKKNTT